MAKATKILGKISNSNEGKKTEWYSEGQIYDLLQHYVGADHIHIFQALNTKDQLSYQLSQLSQLNKSQYIIPLNVSALNGELGHGNHWAGLHIQLNNSSKSVTVNYINPMGYSVNPALCDTIKQVLSPLFTAVTIEQPLLKQGIQVANKVSAIEFDGNLNDCGPMLVYIMTCRTRTVDMVKITDYEESVSLGFFLRKSFASQEEFNTIYATLNAGNHTNTKPDTKAEAKKIAPSNDSDSNSSKANKVKENPNQKATQTAETELLIYADDSGDDIDKEQLAEVERSIAVLEKKLFPNLHQDPSALLPDPAQEKQKALEQISTSYQLGLDYYNENKLAEAEKELVKALRPLLSKPSMKNLYVNTEEVKDQVLDAMYHLGLVYLKDSQYFIHHAKAAAIFQYCAAFAKKYGINPEEYLAQAHNVEKEFLESIKIDTTNYSSTRGKIDHYRSELETLRTNTKQKLYDINHLTIDTIAKRAEIVKNIYQDCSSVFVNPKGEGVIQRLLADCYQQLGGIPEGCEHAVIALGSLSLGTMTPWSDLEWAILVNDDRYKEYFRNVSKLFHIKVINLGETHLKSMGVESLNNFKTDKPEDEWFWDDVMKIKFNFDSARWDACKVPLGRQGGYKVNKKIKGENGTEKKITITKPDYELILTPDQMLEFQGEERTIMEEDSDKLKNWYETDQFLVQALHSVALIDGSQSLLDGYKARVKVAEEKQILQKRVLDKLQDELNRFKLKLGDEEEGKLMDTKQEIYRIGDRVVNGLAHYYGITAKEREPVLSVWQTIDRMESEKILSQDGAQHLMEAVSIATELRLRTYANNDTREETLRTYEPAVDHLTEEHKHKLLKETCHFQDTTILHHFYYIILRVQNLVKMFCSPECQKQAEIELMYDPLFGNFNYNKGMIYARFLEYDKAIEYMQAAQKELPKNLKVLEQLYFLYGKTRIASTVSIAEEILHLQQHKHQDKLNINIAITYNNLGVAYAEEGNYRIAIKYSQSALDIYLAAHQYNYVAVSYSNLVSYGNLGDTYRSKGEYDKAAQSFKKALSIHNMVHEGCLNHPGIAANYNNLGLLYIAQNDCKKAINYFKRALEIYNVAYARCPNHPDIAMGYNNLGFAHTENEEYEEATLHFRKALSIYNIIYSGCSNHPDIAASYNNLGFMYGKKKKYDEAVEYCQKSLDIYYIIYTKCPNHPDIAMSYNNLGNAYADKGEYEQAIEYHEQTLAIRLKAYEANSDHPDIAMSYNNLGVAYANIGEYKKSIDCFKMALDIRLRVYEQSPNHPVIADSYNNLGEAYSDKGEYEQAEKYYQDALEMYKKIYKTNLNHHKIVNCQNSLIETKVIKSFSDFRKKVKDENDDTKIIINTKGLAEEDIKNYCKAKFDTSFSFSSITFEKNECYITLDKNCREILSRQIVMQELSNNSNDIANLPIKLSRDIANFQDIPYKEDGTLRVISYNITADYYDSNDQTEDKHHHWSYRAPFVKMLLKTLDADIICLQELSPSQALELHQYFSTGRGYSSIFLSQTPSDVEVGTIVQGEAVKEWCGKFMGTPLVGIFLSKLYKLIDKGRFWLNETPDTIPENFDRGTTDKGFNNVNTYKAVLWAKVQMDDSKILFVFNSHYPFSGDSKTRLECAKLEMAKVKEITRGDNWVSAGDRNFVSTVQDNEQYNPQTAYEELVKEGRDVRDAKAHYGISTSWLGFSYDKCKNEIKSGDFTNDCVLDVMVSSLYSKFSFCHHGAFNPVTRELVPLSGGLNEEQNEGRYFSSDHALVGADLFLS